MSAKRTIGRSLHGIVTPFIREGDDLVSIVINSLKEAINDPDSGFKLKNGDVVATTEAVVAIAQQNFATYDDIAKDVENKFAGAKTLAVVAPIMSRNRFVKLLEAIASAKCLEQIIVVLTYPSDEVGNELISKIKLMEADVNENTVFTAQEFTEKFGEPCHVFTGVNYLKLYADACKGKAEVVLCNDFSKIHTCYGCTDYLICSIHNAAETEAILRMGERDKPFRILTMADILNSPVNGSGYHPKYGLYGTNATKGDKVKLMPRDGQKYVEDLKNEIFKAFGVHVECMVYGDGAFKDPVGGIWELADPTTTLAATNGICGTPNELKLKNELSAEECSNMSQEELEQYIADKKKLLEAGGNKNNELTLGTTPRQLTDIIASACDLTSGSGDECTPVVVASGYLKNYNINS